MAIGKLNIQVTAGQLAKASDFNAVVGKANELIDGTMPLAHGLYDADECTAVGVYDACYRGIPEDSAVGEKYVVIVSPSGLQIAFSLLRDGVVYSRLTGSSWYRVDSGDDLEWKS